MKAISQQEADDLTTALCAALPDKCTTLTTVIQALVEPEPVGGDLAVLQSAKDCVSDIVTPPYYRSGDSGSEVQCIQEAMMALDADALPQWGADGIAGSEFSTWLANIQGDLGLTADSVFGPMTQAGMLAELDNRIAALEEEDTDGDGVLDADDACPTVYGTGADGCPEPGVDSDGDGVLDEDDQCPDTPADATVDAEGCEVVVTGEFTVSLAADNPASATIVADTTTADGAQSMIPVMKFVLDNGESADVTVTELQFDRAGISADADVSQAYLYDENDDLIGEYNSFSSGVLTFSSATLINIPSGASKAVTLKIDLANGTASGKTISFNLTSIDSNATTDLSAQLPLSGNVMATAQTGDLGKLTVSVPSSPSATVDPQDDLDVFNFDLAGSDQIIHVQKLTFTNIGSTDADDLQNFELIDGATPIGDVVASMESDKTVTFDLSADPLVIDKGITKNMHLRADIIGGSGRTFQFSFQNMTDIVAVDAEYNVFIKPNQADSWTIVQSANASQINVGKMTLTRADDSPTGNVALGGTNVVIGEFDLKASGEDVKITSMVVRVYGTVGADGLNDGKIMVEGSQKGSTSDLNSSSTDSSAADTTFSFGNTFIIPAGETHTLQIKADVKKADGTAYSGGETLTAKIQSFVAQGRSSLQTVSSSSATGYSLTIAAGTLSTSVNQAQPNWTSSTPTGVPGGTQVLVGSFVVTAGSGEGADITAVKITDGGNGFTNLQNLRVYKGDKDTGTEIGTGQSSLTTGTSYNFYPSPYISLAKSEQVVINAYADILTTASTGTQGNLVLDEVDGVGQTTNTSVNYTTDTTGQTIWIASAGTLTIAQQTGVLPSAQLVAGTSDVEFAKIKFTAGEGEDIEVTNLVVTATLGGSAPTSTLSNIELSGTGLSASAAPSLASNGTATFDISGDPWVIPAGQEKVLTLKSDIGNYQNIASGGTVALGFATSSVTYKGAVSGTPSTGPGSSITGSTMYTYKTTVTAAPASDSPVGPSFPAQYERVLYFDVTNNGSYSAWLNDATFTINYTQGTGYATTAADRTFNLYDENDLNTSLGSATIGAGMPINGAAFNVAISGGYEIPGNSTKTFYLIGDTRDAGVTSGSNAGSLLQFLINAGTDFDWDDAVSTSIQTTQNKTFPLKASGVLSY